MGEIYWKGETLSDIDSEEITRVVRRHLSALKSGFYLATHCRGVLGWNVQPREYSNLHSTTVFHFRDW